MTEQLNIKVTTRNLNDLDSAPLTRIVDYKDYDAQIWLRNHIWWATHNNHTVHIEQTDERFIRE